MHAPLRVLIVEDSEDDALLLVRELRRGGFEPAFERVDTPDALRAALARQEWDILFADYSMPHFTSTAVLYATSVHGQTFRPNWVSENITRIMGHAAAEALGPTWWTDHLHPEDRDPVLAAVPSILSRDHVALEYRFRHKDGSYHWIHDEARLTRDTGGRPVEVFGSWVDITERKALEMQLLQAQKMEAVGLLAGGGAPPFHNVPTARAGYAEVFRGGLPRGRARPRGPPGRPPPPDP